MKIVTNALFLILFLLSGNSKATEPTFKEIANASLNSYSLNQNFNELLKRARKASYLPTLYAGFDHQTRQAQSLTIQDNVSISSGDITVGPSESNNDYDTTIGDVIRIRAVWRLDELIYNTNELAIIREKRSWLDTKNSFLNDLYKIYELRHLSIAQYKNAKSADKKALFFEKAKALTSRLDEMTNGKFINQWEM